MPAQYPSEAHGRLKVALFSATEKKRARRLVRFGNMDGEGWGKHPHVVVPVSSRAREGRRKARYYTGRLRGGKIGSRWGGAKRTDEGSGIEVH